MSIFRLRAVAIAVLKRLDCANFKTIDVGGSENSDESSARHIGYVRATCLQMLVMMDPSGPNPAAHTTGHTHIVYLPDR
jgi:hypothetical protein